MFNIINTNMITILKKIINDYCKLTNNNDIKTIVFINTLIEIKHALTKIMFDYYDIITIIRDQVYKHKNFNSEILLKICEKNLDLWYYKDFDNFLIEHNIKSSFVKNLKYQKKCSLIDLMLFVHPNIYISEPFLWDETKEKYEYWNRYNTLWMEYLKNKLKSLSETQKLNRHQICRDICDFLSYKNILIN